MLKQAKKKNQRKKNKNYFAKTWKPSPEINIGNHFSTSCFSIFIFESHSSGDINKERTEKAKLY